MYMARPESCICNPQDRSQWGLMGYDDENIENGKKLASVCCFGCDAVWETREEYADELPLKHINLKNES